MNAEQLLKSVARAEELGKRFYPHLIEEDNALEENNTAFFYPSRELSNFQDSSGEEAEPNFEDNITCFHTYSASAYQEDLDGQTLVDEVNEKIIWK